MSRKEFFNTLKSILRYTIKTINVLLFLFFFMNLLIYFKIDIFSEGRSIHKDFLKYKIGNYQIGNLQLFFAITLIPIVIFYFVSEIIKKSKKTWKSKTKQKKSIITDYFLFITPVKLTCPLLM